MHHSYLDKYARRNSPLHRLDARVKVLLTLATIITIAVTGRPGILFVATLILLVCGTCAAAGIPLTYLLLRSAVVLPFSLFAALSAAFGGQIAGALWQWGPWALTSDGLWRAASLLWRSWIAICFMIVLVNTTPFDRMLQAFKSWRIPGLFILLLSFLYRFLYLLWDERERMQRARDVRYFGGRWKKQVALLGQLAASLFLRTYDRAERVQKAMIARGWNGATRFAASVPWGRRDWLAMLCGTSLLAGIWLIRRL